MILKEVKQEQIKVEVMDTLTMNLQALEALSNSSHFGYMSKQTVYVTATHLLIHSPIANFLYLLLKYLGFFFLYLL